MSQSGYTTSKSTMLTKVLVTIDTEVAYANCPDPFERDVLGGANVNPYGTYWIADQLKLHGFPGLFFLDVYGAELYGESRYNALCDRLLSAGHDVQLHTHPHQMYDRGRRYMHQYSLPEQNTIIRDGIALLSKWTGKRPVCHRAGSYGADENTLRALHRNGIPLDSSFFFRRNNCELRFPDPNAPAQACGVWEIPVTVAREPVEKKGIRLPYWTRHFWARYMKLDVNSMDESQLARSIHQLQGRVPYIITFLHSFSFIRYSTSGPDEFALRSFQSLLRLLAHEDIPVITSEQIAGDLGVTTSNPLNSQTILDAQ